MIYVRLLYIEVHIYVDIHVVHDEGLKKLRGGDVDGQGRRSIIHLLLLEAKLG